MRRVHSCCTFPPSARPRPLVPGAAGRLGAQCTYSLAVPQAVVLPFPGAPPTVYPSGDGQRHMKGHRRRKGARSPTAPQLPPVTESPLAARLSLPASGIGVSETAGAIGDAQVLATEQGFSLPWDHHGAFDAGASGPLGGLEDKEGGLPEQTGVQWRPQHHRTSRSCFSGMAGATCRHTPRTQTSTCQRSRCLQENKPSPGSHAAGQDFSGQPAVPGNELQVGAAQSSEMLREW